MEPSQQLIATITATVMAVLGFLGFTDLPNQDLELGATPRVLTERQGGTATSTYVAGDILYSDTANSLSSLPIGSNNQVLKVSSGNVSWGTDNDSGGAGASNWNEAFLNALTPTNTSAGLFIRASSTFNSTLRVNDTFTLSSLDCTGNSNGGALTTDANGVVSCSDDDSGAGGGADFAWTDAGNYVSTSTALGLFNGFFSTASSSVLADFKVEGQATSTISHWIGAGGVATNIDLQGGDLYIQDDLEVDGTIFGALTGNVTGNADTATALVANGSNCSTGQYPLGVDASGAVESCTDATTEIDSAISTHAGISTAHQALVTLAGTPNYLTLSGQEITLTVLDINDDTDLTVATPLALSAGGEITFDQTANFTWTGLHTFTDLRPATINSTTTNIDTLTINTAINLPANSIDFSDDTNATAGTGITFTDDSIAADLGTSIVTGEITDGTILEDDLNATNVPTDNYVLTYNSAGSNFTWAVDATGGSGGSSAWEDTGFATTAISPTTTNAGLFVTGSSTIASSFRVDGNSTTTGSLDVGDIFIADNATSTFKGFYNNNFDIQQLDKLRLNLHDDTSNSRYTVAASTTASVLSVGITAVDPNEELSFNVDNIDYFTSSTEMYKDITSLAGTDLNPKTIYVYVEISGGVPILSASNTDPTGIVEHVDVWWGQAGTVNANTTLVYGSFSTPLNGYELIGKQFHRVFFDGPQYRSGMTPTSTASDLTIDTGSMAIIYDALTSTRERVLEQGIFYIKSDGTYNSATDFSFGGEYSTGETITDTKFFGVTLGIIPSPNVTEDKYRILALVQRGDDIPATKEYTKVKDVIQDKFGVMTFSPSDTLLKALFVPVARVVVKKNGASYTLQEIPEVGTGRFHVDIRNQAVGGGAGADITLSSPWAEDGTTIFTDTPNLSVRVDNLLSASSTLFVTNTTTQTLTIDTGGEFVLNSDRFTDLTGTGLQITAGALQSTLGTSVDLTSEVTGTLPVANGGSGATTLTGLLQGNGTGAFTVITDSSTVGQVLRVTGASTYAWGALDLADTDAITGTLVVANGGTGVTSLTSNGVLYGQGSSALAVTAAGTSAQILQANGSGVPTFVTFSSDIAVAAGGAVTIQTNAVALGDDTTGNYTLSIADAGNSTITVVNGVAEGGVVTLDAVDLNCTNCIGTTEIVDSYLLNNGDVGTGVFDFGGATSFEIPNGTGNTLSAIGQISLDTAPNTWQGSGGQLLIATSTETSAPGVVGRVLTELYSFTVASSTPLIAADIIDMPIKTTAFRVVRVQCYAGSGTSQVGFLSDGTNDTNNITCASDPGAYSTTTSNFEFIAGEKIRFELGTNTGSVEDVSVTVIGYYERE